MARRKKDAPDLGENPFLISFRNKVTVISKTTNLSDLAKSNIEDKVLTELLGDTISFKKNNNFERDEFWIEYGTHDGVNLFEIKLGLSPIARLLYDYIKDSIKRNKTSVYIDKVHFMKIATITSATTFISAKASLIKANIISPSSSSYYGWYWVNPVFFFKGFRADELKEYNDYINIDPESMAKARENKKKNNGTNK